MEKKYNGNVTYDTIKLVQEGKFDEAKKLMIDNNHNEALFMSSIEKVPLTDNMLNFINSFEEPKWKQYVSFMDKKSTLKFLDFAQKNNVNLFEKVNSHNDARLIDVTMGLLIDNYSHNTIDFFKAIKPITIAKALEKDDTLLIVKQWLEKYVDFDDYNKNPVSSTDLLIEKFNAVGMCGLITQENQKILFGRSEFTRKIFALNSEKANELFNQYNDFFKNKDELLDTKILLDFYHHNELNDFSLKRLEKAVETKKFNPNYSLLHKTTIENINKGEFAFSLLINSPKYSIFKGLLKNKLLSTNLYNSTDNSNAPTVFERFITNNLGRNDKKNEVTHFYNVLNEFDILQSYGIEPKANLSSRKQMDDILDRFLGIEESRQFFGEKEKVKIDKDVEELAREIGFHPVQAQKLIAFLDKRYNFSPDLESEQKKSDNEKAIRKSWSELMDKVVFVQEVKEQNTNKLKM